MLSIDLHCCCCWGQSFWHINAAFWTPQSPESVVGTQWNTYFSPCPFFYVVDGLWQLCWTSCMGPWLLSFFLFFFFFHFFPRHDLAPDAKSTNTPTYIPRSAQTNLPFLPTGRWYQSLHWNRPHLTPSDNPTSQWPQWKRQMLGSFSTIW